MAVMLVAPDVDDYETAGHCTVDTNTLLTVWPIFVAPENFSDYANVHPPLAYAWAP